MPYKLNPITKKLDYYERGGGGPSTEDHLVKIGPIGTADYLSSLYFERTALTHIIPIQRIDDAIIDDDKTWSSTKIEQELITHTHRINERIVFCEQFTGNGIDTDFTLTGSINNGTFHEGTWDVDNFLNSLEVECTKTNNGILYDSLLPFTRNKISVSSSTVDGIVTLNHAPRNNENFYIWYWYELKEVDVIEDYYRSDFVSKMEAAIDQIASEIPVDTTNFNNILGSLDVDVQHALETLDDHIHSTGFISVEKDNTSVDLSTSILNFVGSGVAVEDTDPGERVTIYIPAIVYAPYYNAGIAAVADISTTSRYVSAPTTEGNPFHLGDWTPGTLHPCTNSATWVYSTASACSFKSQSTTFEISVLDADGVSVLANMMTASITGNTDITLSGIRFQVTGWVAEGSRFKASVSITFAMGTILPASGRCSISITHHNGTSDYTKTQSGIFYDRNPDVNELEGGDILIEEVPGSVVTKFLSGVEYYTLTSRFSLSIPDIDYINSDTYSSVLLEARAPLYGLATLSIGSGNLTNWNYQYNDLNDYYLNQVWDISVANVFTASAFAVASARAMDWTPSDWKYSSTHSILVDTYSTLSTRLVERFRQETWRCPISADFDLTNRKSWDSSVDVGASDAVFFNGACERSMTNFKIYSPNASSQPDYSSGMDPEVFLIREFNHDGSASSGFTLTITGTFVTLEMKLAKEYDGTSSGGTVWIDMTSNYNASEWNNGDPLNGSGCLTGTSHYTFGTNNIINCGDTMYLKIGFIAGQSITALSVAFD